VILVTQKDGTSVALNVDRLERIERNAMSLDDESNVFFVGGAHLVVQESLPTLVDMVLEAKARVQARAAVLAANPSLARTPAIAPLRMVPHPDSAT
jgi:uncharacterized protein YlzI (FlbEa/FlbD family)